MKINVVTLCSGYDAQCLALERLKRNYPNFDYELIDWAEIDKYAIQAHDALFPKYADRNIGDITSCDWSKITQSIDLLTYSTPCQSISSAGKQEGLKKDSGTTSSIIWSVLNAIDALKPKYLLMENVKALVSSKFIGDFHEWQAELVKRGYSNFAKVLNSKDFGVPQNRERVFMVSILNCDETYHFPNPFPLEKRLMDILDAEVDESYYLSSKIIDTFNKRNEINAEKRYGFRFEPTFGDCVASSVLTMPGSRPCDNYIKEPMVCAMRGREVQCLTPKRMEYGKRVRKDYGSVNLDDSRHNMQQLELRNDGISNTITSVQKDNLLIKHFVHVIGNIYGNNEQSGRIYDSECISPTIGTCCGGNQQPKIIKGMTVNPNRKREFRDGTIHSDVSPCITSQEAKNTSFVYEQDFRIRKLTPRECFRLQDVDDEDIDKMINAGISKTQLYKLAGNSITISPLYHIFRKLFIEKDNENQQLTLF